MFTLDDLGRVQHPKIKLSISPNLEKGDLTIIHGIVVHQTGSSTAQATLNGYKTLKPNGAHFLIDKDGTIYQTASLYKTTLHVGFIKSRCIAERSCSPADLKNLKGKKVGAEISRIKMRKPFPSRYPFNNDSIGIEIVSLFKREKFEPLTENQQTALTWLLNALTLTLNVNRAEIFRHSEFPGNRKVKEQARIY